MTQRSQFASAKRVVVKAGTSVITNEDGNVSLGRLGSIIEQVAKLNRSGKEVIYVTSGATGIGGKRLQRQLQMSLTVGQHMEGVTTKVTSDRAKAAAGQSVLMSYYDSLFTLHDVLCAQVLVTESDFSNPHTISAVYDTFEFLFRAGVVPIVNENDVVSSRMDPNTDENNRIFWDNDSLAAFLSIELKADLCILLSDVDGLYKEPPNPDKPQFPMSTYVPSDSTTDFVIGKKSRLGRGGMKAKIEAAVKAVRSGVPAVVIANGFKPGVVNQIMRGEIVGTLLTMRKEEGDNLVQAMVEAAMSSARALSQMTSMERQAILEAMVNELERPESQREIMEANQMDLRYAESQRVTRILPAIVITKPRLQAMIKSFREIALDGEALGQVVQEVRLPDGALLQQLTAPIGMLMGVFESRPELVPRAIIIAVKSGSAIVIKGGNRCDKTNAAFFNVLSRVIPKASNGKVGSELISLVRTETQVRQLLSLHTHIDMAICVCAERIVREMKKHTRIPMVSQSEMVCGIYLDSELPDLETTKGIVEKSLADAPGISASCRILLIHTNVTKGAGSQGEKLIEFLKNKGIKLLAGPLASHRFNIEYSSPDHSKLSEGELFIEIVEDFQTSVEIINEYCTGHADSIVTTNKETASHFFNAVNSACLLHNKPTRIVDDPNRQAFKSHMLLNSCRSFYTRGPISANALLTTKWVLSDTSEHERVGEPAHISLSKL